MTNQIQTQTQKTMYKYAGTICDETGEIALHVSNSPSGAKNLSSYKPKMLELPYPMYPKECGKYVTESEFFTEYERACIRVKTDERYVDLMSLNLKYTPNSVFDLGRTSVLSKR